MLRRMEAVIKANRGCFFYFCSPLNAIAVKSHLEFAISEFIMQ